MTRKQLAEYEIPEIDLVIVDLYPFEETVASGAEEQAIIEKNRYRRYLFDTCRREELQGCGNRSFQGSIPAVDGSFEREGR